MQKEVNASISGNDTVCRHEEIIIKNNDYCWNLSTKLKYVLFFNLKITLKRAILSLHFNLKVFYDENTHFLDDFIM